MQQRIYFASLQSSFAQDFLPEAYKQEIDFDTIIYFTKGSYYERSGAVLRVLKLLDRFYFRWLAGFLIVPAFIRDFVYRIFARNRYRWFGKKDNCRIPTQEERTRFLDGENHNNSNILRG